MRENDIALGQGSGARDHVSDDPTDQNGLTARAFEIDVPAEVREARVPPMTSDNLGRKRDQARTLAVARRAGSSDIGAHLDGHALTINVVDTGQGFQANLGVGVGLANVRARLAMLYASCCAAFTFPESAAWRDGNDRCADAVRARSLKMNAQPLAMPAAFGSAASSAIAFVHCGSGARQHRNIFSIRSCWRWPGADFSTQRRLRSGRGRSRGTAFERDTDDAVQRLRGLVRGPRCGSRIAAAAAPLVALCSRAWWLEPSVGSSLLWFVTQRLFEIRTAYAFPRAIRDLPCTGMARMLWSFADGNFHLRVRGDGRALVSRRCALCNSRRADVRSAFRGPASAAMQARVEPQFLRDTLAQVERL